MVEKATRESPAKQDVIVKDGIEYEEVSHDDRVIGRAFRVSLVVLGILLVIGGGGYWWLNRPKQVAPPQASEPVAAPKQIEDDVHVPSVRFTDVTAAAGIDFVHQNGAEGAKLLPETMGGGCAFVDPDLDGDADVILVNGCFWPESAHASEKPTQAYYSNDGTGRFTNVTENAGLDVTFYGMGVSCADADSDGDPDAFFTAVGPNHYFTNQDAHFEERDVGVGGDGGSWSTCSCFFDAEKDGDLDLYVGRYVRWSREIDISQDYRLNGIGRAYGPPNNFEGAQPYFFRNEGDGRFSDVTEAAGFLVKNPATGVAVGKALGVRACDLDLDGDVDLMVANDTVAKFFYLNKGDGSFEERGKQLGLAFNRDGQPTGSMGIDASWFRNDAAIGIAIGNFANEMTSFYVSQGRTDLWADEAIGIGIGAPTRKFLKFGTLFLDYDLDGRQDFLQVNGHLEADINQVQSSQTYEQPAQLFWNAGPDARRTFAEVDGKTTGDLTRPIVGRGGAAADIDADGDLDVLLTQSGGKPMLLRNDQTLGNHWLRLRLVASGKNREAIGARVELVNKGVKQCLDVIPFKSYLSQCELPLTFGLGSATKAERVTIHWPDGKTQELTDLAADKLHVIEQGG